MGRLPLPLVPQLELRAHQGVELRGVVPLEANPGQGPSTDPHSWSETARGVYITVTKASCANDTFEKMCAKLEANSKESAKGSKFTAGCSFELPSTTMRGHTKGKYANLETDVGVAINPSGNNDCLTRPNNGLFYWSEEETSNKIRDAAMEEKLC